LTSEPEIAIADFWRLHWRREVRARSVSYATAPDFPEQ